MEQMVSFLTLVFHTLLLKLLHTEAFRKSCHYKAKTKGQCNHPNCSKAILQRVLAEQTERNTEGEVALKNKKQISPSSLQNPSDPDATYRSKAGKDNKGYVGNLVETFDQNGAIITAYDYQVNSHSDSSFCKETIEKLGVQETETTLIADGAYASVENVELAANNNIDLVTTALLGKSPDVLQADFQIDSDKREVMQCPAGNKPYKTSYYEKTGMYRASFNKKTCDNCPHREQCGAKLQKNLHL